MPSGSMGYFDISNYDDENVLWNARTPYDTSLNLGDGWALDAGGQSLTLLGDTVFSNTQINVVNRVETITTSDKVFSMSGFESGYTYGKRYIKNLWVK
jgi:hypothetical protein